jgi:hypothetical protein
MNDTQIYIGNYSSRTTLHEKALQIFEGIDVSESSQKDYKSRIWLYLQ